MPDNRKIIHVDMDAFFASVEQRDHPELQGKPVVVGGNSKRGVIAAASYEARNYGIRSAMPAKIARQKCPQLIFVKHRFDVYRAVSHQIREIFHRYTDLVEPLSLDEAFLDVTNNKMNYKSAIFIASRIKEDILKETRLTASAGVSINKFVAKIASDRNKPNGLTVILPEEVSEFLEALSIDQFFGVGKATGHKMHRLGIHCGRDLKAYDQIELVRHFGKFGRYLYDVVRGKDDRPVKPNRIRKSFSMERTFGENLQSLEEVNHKLENISDKLCKSLQKRSLKGKTLHLKYRYGDFTTLTRSRTLTHFFNDKDTLYTLSMELALPLWEEHRGVRLLGVGLSNLNNQIQDGQLTLDFD